MNPGVCHIRRADLFGPAIIALIMMALFSVRPTEVQAQSANKPHRRVLVSTQPEYPAVLKSGHFEGQVRLEATVLPNGNVASVEIKGGNPMLSRYASEAVAHWKYVPGPAQTVEEVVFNFRASDH